MTNLTYSDLIAATHTWSAQKIAKEVALDQADAAKSGKTLTDEQIAKYTASYSKDANNKPSRCPWASVALAAAGIALPTLTGVSEAQISYGYSKRDETLTAWMRDYTTILTNNPTVADKAMALVATETTAKFWLDNSCQQILERIAGL